MSRRVEITKNENTTVVKTWDSNNEDLKTPYYYNMGATYYVNNNGVLVIEKPNKVHPTLFVTFEQLEDNLGTSDIYEYAEALAANDYFVVGGASSGGGPGPDPLPQYNTATAYDTVADLPISFPAESIHSISVLCVAGELLMTVNGNQITLVAGQEHYEEADAKIDTAVSIDSCTGSFVATTMS